MARVMMMVMAMVVMKVMARVVMTVMARVVVTVMVIVENISTTMLMIMRRIAIKKLARLTASMTVMLTCSPSPVKTRDCLSSCREPWRRRPRLPGRPGPR